uniref:Uncharacterized protein n=1 Tax=Myripristis murdjan TaxID=586833 RepID=A0A668ACC8_9TELE
MQSVYVCLLPQPSAAKQMWKLSHPFSPPVHGLSTGAKLTPTPFPHSRKPAAISTEVTFDNIAVNSGSELLSGLLVEVLAVDDPHLFEESRLAALASAQQQDLHQPFHVGFLPGNTSVDLFGLSDLFHLAAVEETDGQTNF